MNEAASRALSDGRAVAQSLMDSTVLIRRQTAQVKNPSTGRLEPLWVEIYEGPARLRAVDARPRSVDSAGRVLAEQEPTVGLPVDADDRIVTGTSADVRVDDVGTVLTNPAAPGAVGTRFRVSGQHEQTHSTSRRLPVEVYSHGG